MHKKWYIHGEVFGLTKKLATVIVGHFSLEKHRLKTEGIAISRDIRYVLVGASLNS